MINVGILGSGVGVRTHLPAFRRTGSAFVKTIYSPNTAKLREVAQKFSIPVAATDPSQLFNDDELDLIVVASPNPTHEDYIRQSVEAGKHFLCEKPVGRTADEAKRIAARLPADYQKWTGVNHQLRFNPYLREIRRALADGSLGRLVSMRIAQLGTGFSNPGLQWNWSFDEAAGGGVRLAMGSHLIDLAVFLSGRRVGRIHAHMDPIAYSRPLGEKSVKVSVSSMFAASCEMVDGAHVQVSTNASAFSGNAFDIEIFCDKGEIRFDLDRKLRIFRSGAQSPDIFLDLPGVSPEERANKVSIFSGSFPYFADEIVRDIERGRTSTIDGCDFEQSIYVSEILDAALVSYRTGSAVECHKIDGWRGSY